MTASTTPPQSPEIAPFVDGLEDDLALSTTHIITAPNDLTTLRLDRFLANSFPDLSRNRIQALLEEGHVKILSHSAQNHESCTVTNRSLKVKPGQSFSVTVPPALEALPRAQDIPLKILHEDDALIVIDKAAGMVVHPAAGTLEGTLVNALLYHCGPSLSGIGGVKRPGIVHRLDKDTSGVMVAAKHDQAHHGLSQQFAAHSLERRYQALIWGCPTEQDGRIEGNIGRSPHHRKKMAVVGHGDHAPGKPAVTFFKILERYGLGASLIECRLETGRTHQIRVHMTQHGFPLIGDPLYGRPGSCRKHLAEPARKAADAFTRQALHAASLAFRHPITGEWLSFETDMPEDMRHLQQRLKAF